MAKECTHVTFPMLHYNVQARKECDVTLKHRNLFSTPFLMLVDLIISLFYS